MIQIWQKCIETRQSSFMRKGWNMTLKMTQNWTKKQRQSIDEKSKLKKEQSSNKWLRYETKVRVSSLQSPDSLDITVDLKTLIKTIKELEDKQILEFGERTKRELLRKDFKNNALYYALQNPIWSYQCFLPFGCFLCPACVQLSCTQQYSVKWLKRVNGSFSFTGIRPGCI